MSKGSKINRSQWPNSDSVLHLATREQDAPNVKLLLEKGAYVNTVNGSGNTPLHLAVQSRFRSNSDIGIIQMLLAYNANIHATNNDGETPLELGCLSNQSIVVKLLLERGADVNMCTKRGTPLLLACLNNNVELVALLLRRGANIEATDKEGKTALFLAVKAGNLDIVKLILSYCPNKTSAGNGNRNIFQVAVSGNKHEYSQIIDYLFNYGFSVTADDVNYETFLTSIINGHSKFVEELLKLSDEKKIFQIFKKKNILSSVTESLTVAVRKGRRDIVELLLRYPVYESFVKKNTEIMCCAVDHQRSKVMEVLIKHDAQVNALNEKSLSPLHLAALKGDTHICKMLLDKGAKLDSLKPRVCYLSTMLARNFQNPQPIYDSLKVKATPLHFAVENGHTSVVQLLISYGADLDKKDSKGYTALIWACQNGFMQIVQLLLNSGSDINCMNAFILSYLKRSQREITMTLSKHVTKMLAANLYVDSILFKTLGLNTSGDLRQCCKSELAITKDVKIISDSKTTFNNILTQKTTLVAHYMRNENIVGALKSDEWKQKFPLYAGLITCNFLKAKKRAILLKLGAIFFHKNMPFLPCICTDQILSNLRNEDLITLSEACSPVLS